MKPEQPTAELDIMSRDFTVNALFYDVFDEHEEDYCNVCCLLSQGISDLKNNILRCVKSPEMTFEDPSRYLRAIRFCVTKSFVMDEVLKSYLKDNSQRDLNKLASQGFDKMWSITKEIVKMLRSDQFVELICTLAQSNLITG